MFNMLNHFFKYFKLLDISLSKCILSLILLHLISGYDLYILNSENLLMLIFVYLMCILLLDYSNLIESFNLNNKNNLIKDYYYNFFLIKTFYLIYINLLEYSFTTYNNYFKFYNFFLTFLINLSFIFDRNIYGVYLKFFFNNLNIAINLNLFNFIELKNLIGLNVYFLRNILNIFNSIKLNLNNYNNFFFNL